MSYKINQFKGGNMSSSNNNILKELNQKLNIYNEVFNIKVILYSVSNKLDVLITDKNYEKKLGMIETLNKIISETLKDLEKIYLSKNKGADIYSAVINKLQEKLERKQLVINNLVQSNSDPDKLMELEQTKILLTETEQKLKDTEKILEDYVKFIIYTVFALSNI